MTQTVLPAILLQITPSTSEEHETNLWIAIVVLLLALSLISERITNFFKLHSSSLRLRSTNLEREKLRERSVLYIAILSGLFVAFVSQADLFHMLDKGELSTSAYGNGLPLSLLGMFLAGLFISFGSKFWHDVLDIILQFSNIKKYKSLDLLHEIEDQKSEEILLKRKALQEQAKALSPKLQGIKGYLRYEVAVYDSGRVIIQFFFSQKELNTLVYIKELQERVGNSLEEFEIQIST